MSLPPSYNLLEKYPNTYYIETGVWRGDSIQLAGEAGFKHILGLDNDPEAIEFCKNRFALHRLRKDAVFGFYKGHPGEQTINILLSDSATQLWSHIQQAPAPITFFLDAHSQMFEDEIPGPNPFPLLKELEQIGRHPIKTHTIIVDDWHIFYPDRVGYSKQDVKDAVLKINPDYKFTMVANPVIDGILIATV